MKPKKSVPIEKRARQFENAAAAALTYLGKLSSYSPEDIRRIAESPEGRQMGTAIRSKQVRERLLEVLEAWGELEEPVRTIDAEPLIEVLPPERQSKTLDQLH
ncbi:hypothetical protein ACFP81_10715 [Deinococcus lacus]|uniref:Uncharacterized protein n=1 Tax=Deinococcus lacus TaxID=392561 RepID=A0ABW1YFT7_9DEIO